MLKENIIINGDCIEQMKKLRENSIDLIFADPPYYLRANGNLKRIDGTIFNGCNDEWDKFKSLNEYKNFTKKWLQACYKVLNPNGSIWVIG